MWVGRTARNAHPNVPPPPNACTNVCPLSMAKAAGTVSEARPTIESRMVRAARAHDSGGIWRRLGLLRRLEADRSADPAACGHDHALRAPTGAYVVGFGGVRSAAGLGRRAYGGYPFWRCRLSAVQVPSKVGVEPVAAASVADLTGGTGRTQRCQSQRRTRPIPSRGCRSAMSSVRPVQRRPEQAPQRGWRRRRNRRSRSPPVAAEALRRPPSGPPEVPPASPLREAQQGRQ